PLSPRSPPKACNSMRDEGRIIAAFRSPARKRIWSIADSIGSVASLANRITLRRVGPPVVTSDGGVALAVRVGAAVLDCFWGAFWVAFFGCRVSDGPPNRLPGLARVLV